MNQTKKQHQTQSLNKLQYTPKANKASPALLLGTKTTQCDICKVTKQTYLFRYGFTLCEECINICIDIVEQLNNESASEKPKEHLPLQATQVQKRQ
ncbi:MAG: hypothetical protein NWE98_00125 [Candidatus Bathyarchaeota archaeon]|nr:hypothetical protein [Candidatus Bathyarchaeota archaeon]